MNVLLMETSLFVLSKCKGKALPKRGHKDPEGEWRYNSTLSLTSALDGGGWLTPRPGRFTPSNETRYPLCGRLSGQQSGSGWVRKISPSPGFESRTVHSVASRNTDYAISTHFCSFYLSQYQSSQDRLYVNYTKIYFLSHRLNCVYFNDQYYKCLKC